MNGARETTVQGEAVIKAPKTMAMIRMLVLTFREIGNPWTIDWKLCSDMNKFVFWKDHIKARLERVRMDKGRTDELQWMMFINTSTHPCNHLLIH